MKRWDDILAVLLLIVFLTCLCGCKDDPVRPPSNGGDRYYGPPFGEIAFLDGGLVLGTISPDEDSTRPYFVYNTGISTAIPDPGFIPTWVPPTNVLDTIPEFLLYDSDYKELLLLDRHRDRKLVSDSVAHLAFSLSPAGTRLAYIRDFNDSTQHLIWESVGSGPDLIDFYTIEPPFRVKCTPSITSLGLSPHILINLSSDTDPSSAEYFMVNSQGETMHHHNVNAIDVKIDPFFGDGMTDIAYIPGSNGAEQAGTIIWNRIIEGQFELIVQYDFSDIGTGATTFCWSPDGLKIALYVGVFGADPRLVVVSDDEEFVSGEIVLEKDIVLPTGDDLYFAAPDWSPESDRLVLLVRNDEDDTHEVVIVDIESGEMLVKVDGLPSHVIFRPTWKK